MKTKIYGAKDAKTDVELKDFKIDFKITFNTDIGGEFEFNSLDQVDNFLRETKYTDRIWQYPAVGIANSIREKLIKEFKKIL